MLQFSEGYALGVHASVLIASGGGSMSAPKIAEMLSVSRDHLAKVMRKLVVAGLVESQRGVGGGFLLTRLAAEVSLWDIYRAVEGDFPQKACLFKRKVCSKSECVIGCFISKVNNEVKEYLQTTMIQELFDS